MCLFQKKNHFFNIPELTVMNHLASNSDISHVAKINATNAPWFLFFFQNRLEMIERSVPEALQYPLPWLKRFSILRYHTRANQMKG